VNRVLHWYGQLKTTNREGNTRTPGRELGGDTLNMTEKRARGRALKKGKGGA